MSTEDDKHQVSTPGTPADPGLPGDGETDVEGHNMGLHPTVAWELAKARQREISRDVSRHSLIAESKKKTARGKA